MTASEAKKVLTPITIMLERGNGKNILTKAMGLAIEALDLLEKQEQIENAKTCNTECTEYEAVEILADILPRYFSNPKVQRTFLMASDLLNRQEQGLLIELPVPIGSEHYFIHPDRRRGIKRVKVVGCWKSANDDCNEINIADVEGSFSIPIPFDSVNEVLLPTKEEAEKRLKELRMVVFIQQYLREYAQKQGLRN